MINHEEKQYHDLVREIIEPGGGGIERPDRTGVGTKSVFGRQLRYSLRNDDRLPLLATKRVFWRAVVLELLWFIRGDTNARRLADDGCRIWLANGTREYLDSVGLHERPENDLGPVYGFQWRHWGAEYRGCNDDYNGKGVDQLKMIIERIKTNPYDRRLVMSAWNPLDVPLMALPPCHMFCQFYVANGELSCLMYQRSCDMGLGVPFNIASYSLLTRMVAQVCSLKPGEFIHSMGDCHVYMNHIEPLMEQLKRPCDRLFPRVRIDPSVKDIDQFRPEHFTLEDYRPYETIKMEMAV